MKRKTSTILKSSGSSKKSTTTSIATIPKESLPEAAVDRVAVASDVSSAELRFTTGRIRSHIPEELVEQILTRLPIIDLYTAKCVCTLWRSIVTSPEFIEKHCQQNHKPHLGLLVSTTNTKTRELQFHYASLYNEDATNPSPLVCRFKLPGYYGTTQVVNNLACLYSNNHASLLNICTREILALPKPPVHRYSRSHYYLGYEDSNKIYKILRRTRNKTGHRITKYEILTVTFPVSSCKWREVKFLDREQQSEITEEGLTHSLCANGTLYWVCNRSMRLFGIFGIVAFDLYEETFYFSDWLELEREHRVSNKWKVLQNWEGLGLAYVSSCGEKLKHYSLSSLSFSEWVRGTADLPNELRGDHSSNILPVGYLPNGDTLLANNNVDDRFTPVYSFDFGSKGFKRFVVGKFCWSKASMTKKMRALRISCIQEDFTPLPVLLGNGNG